MQEVRYDGTEEWTQNPTPEEMLAAVADERNAMVAIHKVGARRTDGGRTYELNALGQWCRVGKKHRNPATLHPEARGDG